MDRFSTLAEMLRRCCPPLELREAEPMAGHTSFRIGGPVRLMALPQTDAEAAAAVRCAADLDVVPFFMGNGTNLLVADSGWEGFVIKCFDGLRELRAEGETITAGSGILLSRLAHFALERGLTGLEFAHGIPGSLGGAVTMDAGAYGGEMRQVVERTAYLNSDGTAGELCGQAHEFGYRRSAFSGGERLILRSRLVLKQSDPAAIKAKMEELAEKRKSKQPLEFPSAGSTFKRPEGAFAAVLIEACGLKGLCAGGAQVSEKHAGFVINRGGATCDDVRRLTDQIRETVLRQTGVMLELEIKALGF